MSSKVLLCERLFALFGWRLPQGIQDKYQALHIFEAIVCELMVRDRHFDLIVLRLRPIFQGLRFGMADDLESKLYEGVANVG